MTACEFSTLAAGYTHTCGLLLGSGDPLCWGRNSFNQSFPPSGLRPLVVITAGDEHTCALELEGGRPVCWGRNMDGESSPPGGLNLSAITAGERHTCGLEVDTGRPVCWGQNGHGQSEPPESSRFTAIAAGARHTCGVNGALFGDSGPVCWGDGPGAASPSERLPLAALRAGEGHTCGEVSRGGRAGHSFNGSLFCWGQNFDGEASPPDDLTMLVFDAGTYHTCGIVDEEAVSGDVPSGSLGQPSPSGGPIVCWGRDEFGQSSSPNGSHYISLALGLAHGCALDSENGTTCWGDERFGATEVPDSCGPQNFTDDGIRLVSQASLRLSLRSLLFLAVLLPVANAFIGSHH